MNHMEIILSLELILTILVPLIILPAVIIVLLIKQRSDNRTLQYALIQKQSRATQIGRNTALGDIHQFIGDFALLAEYDELILLSTTSRQPSLDVIGIKEERMDFIEIKKKGARMTSSENKVRQIIESKKVRYIVKEVEIPTEIQVEERELPPMRAKK